MTSKDKTTKEEIHRLADKANIPWDNNKKFLRWSKQLTGKAHLDDMTPAQLQKVKKAIISKMKSKTAAVLTAKGRNQIKESNFALDGRRYPIHDRSHARNALSRVSQHGTPEEKAKVRAAVARKYPGIGKTARARLGHVEQRAKERSNVTPEEINKLRKSLSKLRLRRGMTYHYTWPGRGHAIIGDVGVKVPKHVVKTIYRPSDSPPGKRLVKLGGSARVLTRLNRASA